MYAYSTSQFQNHFWKWTQFVAFLLVCGLFFRVECGLYITDTSAHRILSSAIRPLCCATVIKFLCVPEIMETILLFPLSRCAIFPLRCLPLPPSPLYSLWFYCRGHWQHTPHTHTKCARNKQTLAQQRKNRKLQMLEVSGKQAQKHCVEEGNGHRSLVWFPSACFIQTAPWLFKTCHGDTTGNVQLTLRIKALVLNTTAHFTRIQI